MIARPSRCWAWDTIEELLKDGPASVSLLTSALFGDTSLVNRKLVARMMHGLTKVGKEYAGGPYVMRVRDGVYALPSPEFVPARERVVLALSTRIRTFDELQSIAGVTASTITHWLADLRKSGDLREEYAPQDFAERDGKKRARVYWLKATIAAQRWSELKSQRRIRQKIRASARRRRARKKEMRDADQARRDGSADGGGSSCAAYLVPEFVFGGL